MKRTESVKSRLEPLTRVIEELYSRREDGYNDFTKEEPAVGRLLNILDQIFGEESLEPGGFIDFIKTVVQSLPHSSLTHDPLELVLQKNFPDKVEALQFWIICCLNIPNSMKQTLHLALPQQDVLNAFVMPTSPLFDQEYTEELLAQLSRLHNHPTMRTTTFKLDITAAQLFNEKPQPVAVVIKKRSVARGGGGASSTVRRRAIATASHHEDAMSARSGASKPETSTAAVQTDEAVALTSPLSMPRGGGLPAKESWAQTDNPTLHLTYQDICDMERDLNARDKEIKAKMEKLQRREQQAAEAERDVNDRLTALTHTLKSMKVLYNDMFTAAREAQSQQREVSEADISRLVPDILGLVFGGRRALPAAAAQSPVKLSSEALSSMSGVSPMMQSGSSLSALTAADDVDVASPDEGIVLLTDDNPNVAPHALEGVKDLVLMEPLEKERNAQLHAQDSKCPGCSAPLSESSTNTLLKVVQKAGDALRVVQKPRRCHYCCMLFCHKCHTNKTMMLPFRVVHRWDFTQQHVCDRCYTVLRANISKAVLNIKQMPLELQQKATVVRAVELRRKLFIASRVMAKCTSATATTLLKLHYFVKERFYSIADFSRLKGAERTGMNMNPLTLAAGGSGGSGGEDLLVELDKLLAQARAHVTKCAGCLTRGSMECKICRESKRVNATDDGVTQCRKCLSLYHEKCLDSMECRVCHP